MSSRNLDLAEVDNAVAGIEPREIQTRFDFKGSKCSVKRARRGDQPRLA